MIRHWMLLFIAAAVAVSCDDLPAQGGQRWRRRRLAKDIAKSAGVREWDMATVTGRQTA